MRNFIRKWGTTVKHDRLMKPIISPKYDIGFIFKNSRWEMLHALEPWCNTIYVDPSLAKEYIEHEQKHTTMNLQDRVKPYDNEKNNNIFVEIDGNTLAQQDFEYIQQLPDIITDSGELGEFELGNLKIEIINLKRLI